MADTKDVEAMALAKVCVALRALAELAPQPSTMARPRPFDHQVAVLVGQHLRRAVAMLEAAGAVRRRTLPKRTPGPWRVMLRYDGTAMVFPPDGHRLQPADTLLLAGALALEDALQQLMIGIGMGWDLDGLMDAATEVLNRVQGGAQSS